MLPLINDIVWRVLWHHSCHKRNIEVPDLIDLFKITLRFAIFTDDRRITSANSSWALGDFGLHSVILSKEKNSLVLVMSSVRFESRSIWLAKSLSNLRVMPIIRCKLHGIIRSSGKSNKGAYIICRWRLVKLSIGLHLHYWSKGPRVNIEYSNLIFCAMTPAAAEFTVGAVDLVEAKHHTEAFHI